MEESDKKQAPADNSIPSPDRGIKRSPTVDATESPKKKFPRISRPLELIRHEYDVVVVGSGYGGGVAASRMSRAGRSVCVLERGKEKWPGEYPITLKEALSELHTSGEFAKNEGEGNVVDLGDPTGLYHLIVGSGQNAFVANGLGGTSLLNANVFLKADRNTLAMKAWPKELRGDELDPFYERAEHMLEPASYPQDWPKLPKLELLEQQAKLLGREKNFCRVPQTTRFKDGPNSTGIEMKASTLTGMDSTGINDGSKTTTLVTYLSDAWNWGAEMFCECEVRYVKKSGKGYDVFFAWHGGKRVHFKENIYKDLLWVHAKELVFFGAGSLGTTEILLRSKANGLSLSDQIGKGMSGNGDILAFGYNCDPYVNSMGRQDPPATRPVGPTITGVIDCRDQENPLNGFVIEEGAVPKALADLFQDMLDVLPGKIYPRGQGFKQRAQRSLAAIGSRIYGPYHPSGSIEHTQVYLIMSHDDNQAIMTLMDDRPVLKFMGVGRSEHVKYLNDLLAEATTSVGGTFINNPFFAKLNQQEITVHPIGGACISSDGSADLGATTHCGELLTGVGKDYHKGLVVTDGALVPTSLGVNPFATITALAERSVQQIASKRGWNIDYETQNGIIDPFGQPAHLHRFKNQTIDAAIAMIRLSETNKSSSIEFTEVMTGDIYINDDIDDFDVAAKAAKSMSQTGRFFLTMHAWDEDQLLLSEGHLGMLTGTFTHGSLPASPYMVLRGEFRLFNIDPRTPGTRNLSYDFDMVGTDGSVLHFHGYKIADDAAAGSLYDVWKETSTLYVRITEPKSNKNVGIGVLHIAVGDLVSELTTFATSGSSWFSRLTSPFKFLSYFAGNVARIFLGPFAPLEWPLANPVAFYNKESPYESYTITASDGVASPVLRWEPTSAVLGRNESPRGTIFLIPGASVDHQIFAMPTIKRNAIEFYTNAGFRCYTVTHRMGRSPNAISDWTTYDARLDVAAAMTFIRSQQQPEERLYVVAHCAGSVALCAGLLDGTVSTDSWLAGITMSNVSFTPLFGRINDIKASSPISLTNTYKTLAGPYFSCVGVQHPSSIVQSALDQMLRFYPVGSRREICNSATCHRSSLAFGRLWSHKNLNEATHSQLDRFLGPINMKGLAHFVAMGRQGAVLTNDNKTSLVTEENLRRLEGFPILLFSGADNVVYRPENTDRAYSMLRDRFGPDNYQRVVFEGKGHLDCWMSEKAVNDVWPRVLKHVQQSLGLHEGEDL